MTEFEEIYDRYFKDVYRFALSMTKDQHLAEDITSETFLKALDSIAGFQGNCDIRVWLCQITKNTYYSWLRKNNKLVPVEFLPESLDFSTDHAEVSSPVERQVVRAMDSITIQRILHTLTETQREVFSLRIYSELSFKEIGTLFGRSENWACVTYHRAKHKIIKKLEAENES